MGDESAFSISRAVQATADGGSPKRYRVAFSPPRKRSLDSTAGAGALATLRATAAEFVEASRARSILGLLGARFASYGGGRSKVEVPRITAGAAASWVAEEAAPGSNTNPAAAEKMTLTPRQLTASVRITRTMAMNAGGDLDDWVMADLAGAVGSAVDAAGLAGAGGNAPTGVLNDSNVPILAIGANGGAPTRAHLLAALKAVLSANGGASATSRLGWASSVDGEVKLRSVDGSTAGAGAWLWDDDEILDKPAYSSTALPNNLTKGSGAGLSPLIFGDWDQLVVNLPDDGMDVLVNPFTVAPDVIVTVFLEAAVGVRRASSFVLIKDMVTTLS